MRRRARLFHVVLKDGNGRLFEADVNAETYQLACNAAEITVPGTVAVWYRLESELAGRCAKCGCFVEIHERYQTDRAGNLKCADCK